MGPGPPQMPPIAPRPSVTTQTISMLPNIPRGWGVGCVQKGPRRGQLILREDEFGEHSPWKAGYYLSGSHMGTKLDLNPRVSPKPRFFPATVIFSALSIASLPCSPGSRTSHEVSILQREAPCMWRTPPSRGRLTAGPVGHEVLATTVGPLP